MVGSEERPHRLDADVGREDEEADSDKLLRPSLGGLGVTPAHTEAPDDDETCQRLDQGVEAEANQCDRRGRDARTDGDGKFHEMPSVATPCEQPGAPSENRTLVGWSKGLDRRRQRF